MKTGPSSFSDKACERQARFERGTIYELITEEPDIAGDLPQQRCLWFSRELAEYDFCFACQRNSLHRLIQARRENWLASQRIEGWERI